MMLVVAVRITSDSGFVYGLLFIDILFITVQRYKKKTKEVLF